MKHHSLVWIGQGTVLLIPDHWCTKVLHRHTYLVSTACFDGDFDEVRFIPGIDEAVVGNRFFPLRMILVHRLDVQMFILQQPTPYRS